jgi:hypothetical protein
MMHASRELLITYARNKFITSDTQRMENKASFTRSIQKWKTSKRARYNFALTSRR